MKIIYKQGDLLSCTEPWILHGCNMQSKMGSGVAAAIKKKYPSAFQTYLASKELGGMKLGVVTYTNIDTNDKCIFNGITQEFYGRDGRKYVDYDAVREVMKAMDWYAERYEMSYHSDVAVAMPKIGAGLGGGDWEIISKIIEEESVNFQPVVYSL